MKFLLDRVSDGKEFGIIEVNSLDELKQLNSKYNSKEWWSDCHRIVVDFDVPCKKDEEQGVEGIITIYDDYIE